MKIKGKLLILLLLLFIFLGGLIYKYKDFSFGTGQQHIAYVHSNMIDIVKAIQKDLETSSDIVILSDDATMVDMDYQKNSEVEIKCDFLYENKVYSCKIIGDKKGKSFKLINKEEKVENEKPESAVNIIKSNWNNIEKIIPKKHNYKKFSYDKNHIIENSIQYKDTVYYMNEICINGDNCLISLTGYTNRNNEYYWSFNIYN